MPDTIPSVEPLQFRAGDTVRWKRNLSDYPTATHTLNYYLRQKRGGDGALDILCTEVDGEFQADITRAESEQLCAGEYAWVARVDDGADFCEVGAGTVKVLPNLEDFGVDSRSWAEQRLEEVEAALAIRLGQTHDSHSVNGQSFQGKTDAELFDIRDRLRIEVQQERNAELRKNGQKVRRQTRIKFRRAS